VLNISKIPYFMALVATTTKLYGCTNPQSQSNRDHCIMRYFEMINVSREPQNRSLLYVNEDLRIALILLRAQKSHYAMVSIYKSSCDENISD